jgi:hypothetical protein
MRKSLKRLSHPACKPDRSGLVGVMYILDEPSLRLRQRDRRELRLE